MLDQNKLSLNARLFSIVDISLSLPDEFFFVQTFRNKFTLNVELFEPKSG